jgi:hypothetical protein
MEIAMENIMTDIIDPKTARETLASHQIEPVREWKEKINEQLASTDWDEQGAHVIAYPTAEVNHAEEDGSDRLVQIVTDDLNKAGWNARQEIDAEWGGGDWIRISSPIKPPPTYATLQNARYLEEQSERVYVAPSPPVVTYYIMWMLVSLLLYIWMEWEFIFIIADIFLYWSISAIACIFLSLFSGIAWRKKNRVGF